jgi:hypothetical protein
MLIRSSVGRPRRRPGPSSRLFAPRDERAVSGPCARPKALSRLWRTRVDLELVRSSLQLGLLRPGGDPGGSGHRFRDGPAALPSRWRLG